MASRTLLSCLVLLLLAASAQAQVSHTHHSAVESKSKKAVSSHSKKKVVVSSHKKAVASKKRVVVSSHKKVVVRNAVSPKASLASIMLFTKATSPMFAKVFAKTRTPAFLLDNFEKHAYKFTLFLPTDKALARYRPKANCAKVPMSNTLAQLMVPVMYTGKQLRGLKRGMKLRTMSPVYITILRTKPTVQIAVVNGYNKIVSYATVVKTDALVNQRNFVVHQIDNILTTC